MTNDEIIAMATQVYGECEWHESALLHLEAFAKLVAAHTLANIDPSKFMSCQEAIEAARLAEREACAKVFDELAEKATNVRDLVYLNQTATAIRARGQQ